MLGASVSLPSPSSASLEGASISWSVGKKTSALFEIEFHPIVFPLMGRNGQHLLQMSSKAYKSVQKVFGSYLRWPKARVGQAPKVTCSQNVNPLFVGNCQAQRTSTTNRDCMTFHRRLLTLLIFQHVSLLVKRLKDHKICCSSNRLQVFFMERRQMSLNWKGARQYRTSQLNTKKSWLKVFLEIA